MIPAKSNTSGNHNGSKVTKDLKTIRDDEQKDTSGAACDTTDELKVQLGTLMNSLAILSAEKSRMEANFQTDRSQLRSEREDYEKVIKDLKEKLKRAQHNTLSELEHVKYKLIMARHERDKNQADNSAMIKELQKLMADERRAKELLEQQLKEIKSQVVGKTQNKILAAELEIANNKLKQAEAAVRETPPMLISLQAEIATLRKQHRNAIHEERKRAAAAEQQAKILEAAHETRVAGLEARLAELSETVGGYDRLRHQDQQAIQKLKEQLSAVKKYEYGENIEKNYMQDPAKIVTKIEELYGRLMDMNNNKNCSINMKELLKTFKFDNVELNIDYKDKYDALQQEFHDYRKQMTTKFESLTNNSEKKNEVDNTTELQLTRSHCKNLEEKIRMLNREITHIEKELNMKLEQQSQVFHKEKLAYEHILSQKEAEFRGKIGALEHQLLRQRERSLALIEEKDKEITTLKASFRSILTKNDKDRHSTINNSSVIAEKTIEPVTDFVNSLLTMDSPPLLHYAQELARREIQVAGLRKQISELENDVRENQRNVLAAEQRHTDEITDLETKITRLEAYKSREGANLEYLKNVLVNYLTSTDSSNKRHMLNAIATVLKFTHKEMEAIQRVK
ncbi:hypothetical protein PV325_009276 [Microctonus aethiopoides]|nr:hypothetical protein PV325_009276 [Microctonus aethiopoides]